VSTYCLQEMNKWTIKIKIMYVKHLITNAYFVYLKNQDS
jgi:hypothetical protein